MAQTASSASTPYVTAAQMLLFYSQSIIADILKPTPQSPPPSYLAMLDSTSIAGARLYTHLCNGAGEIEAACSVSMRYMPADLQAMTGVSQVLLQKLNAARSFWSLNQYLKPLTARMEDVPGAKDSWEILKMLKDGVWVFGLLESQGAGEGLPVVQQADPSRLMTPNVVGRAVRLFPNTYLNNLPGGRSSS